MIVVVCTQHNLKITVHKKEVVNYDDNYICNPNGIAWKPTWIFGLWVNKAVSDKKFKVISIELNWFEDAMFCVIRFS